ncbi:hypothetical protein Ahy_A01g000016 [Arachis hypogaea]|uniref:Aminotransferase-like plant mobile domain-containing protein n=1 Tax=Arachis hypogaea TaxID=3818 RepID=A0A445EJ47_ARAHY|nr:hypothetical protein Ahy_A01g000016 [Arachis hypogaea]
MLGVSPPANQIQKFAVNCTWFHETFGECPAGADEETVRHFARAYIMLLLGTQLFADKFDNRIHIRWLPYVVRLEEMCGYSWGSAALAWLYRCMCRVANRHVVKLAGPLQLLQSWIFWRFSGFRPAGYDEFSWPLASRWSGHNPSGSEKGPRVQMWKLRIDMLQLRDLSGGPSGCASEGVGASSYGLMAVCDGTDIFCHRIDSRVDHVLRFNVVADPGPSHDFLEWWSHHGKRFLPPKMYLGDPRLVPILVEVTQRGAGRRVERRARVGTQQSQREWRWLDQAMEEGDAAGRGRGGRQGRGGRRRARAARHDHGDDGDGGHAGVGGVSPHHAGHVGEGSQNQLGPTIGKVSFKRRKRDPEQQTFSNVSTKGSSGGRVRSLQRQKGATAEGASTKGSRGTVSTEGVTARESHHRIKVRGL